MRYRHLSTNALSLLVCGQLFKNCLPSLQAQNLLHFYGYRILCTQHTSELWWKYPTHPAAPFAAPREGQENFRVNC